MENKIPDSSNNDQFEQLITQVKNSLLLVDNYKIPIEKIIKDEFTEAYPVNFLTIKPISGSTDELMLFFSDMTMSVGFVIGLNPIFINVLEDQQLNNLKFDYNIELVEKNENNSILNTA